MITSLPRKTLAWLHQAAAAGVAKRIALRHLMERVEVLEVHDTEDASCWALVRASMHSLRERIEALEAAQRPPADHAPVATEMVTTPESAPVATDDELLNEWPAVPHAQLPGRPRERAGRLGAGRRRAGGRGCR